MVYKSSNVLVKKISEPNLKTFYIGFDLGICQIKQFTEILMDTIVDFAFGYHSGILKKYDRRELIEAATAIYRIKDFVEIKKLYVDQDSVLDDEICSSIHDKYLKRGEFGELILHLILRDYFNTIPLLSKIYFKDSDGFTVHGFDSIHIGTEIDNPDNSTIFLGESKIYHRKSGKSGEKGIKDLVQDIENHFNKDFLIREFTLISKKKHSYLPLDKYQDKNTIDEYEKFIQLKNDWIQKLEDISNGSMKMQDLIKSITVPLICTYQSELFEKHSDDSNINFNLEYDSEMKNLKAILDTEISKLGFNKGEISKSKLNIVLILLPIPSKKELIKQLHTKLYHQQNA